MTMMAAAECVPVALNVHRHGVDPTSGEVVVKVEVQAEASSKMTVNGRTFELIDGLASSSTTDDRRGDRWNNCASFHRSFRAYFGGRPSGRRRRRQRRVTLGDFFRLRIPCTRRVGDDVRDEFVSCIGELQLVWSDVVHVTKDEEEGVRQKQQQQDDGCRRRTLAACRLYFRPHDTPAGWRSDVHGQDEVIALSETTVIQLKRLVEWMDDGDDDDEPSVTTIHRVPTADCTDDRPPPTNHHHRSEKVSTALPSQESSQALQRGCLAEVSSRTDGPDLDGEDEQDDDGNEVTVLPYGRYCRYKALLRRLQPPDVHQQQMERRCRFIDVQSKDDEAAKIRLDIVRALGGGLDQIGVHRSPFFCRDTFDQLPHLLQSHPDLCSQHLVTSLMRDRLREAFDLPRNHRLESHNKWLSSSSSSSSSPISSSSSSSSIGGTAIKERPAVTSDSQSPEQEFLRILFEFMRRRKTPIERVPSLGFKQVNLFAFYMHAKKLGGYEKITVNKLWKRIYDKLGGNPGSTSAATTTRRHYERLLLPFERHYGACRNDIRAVETVRPSSSGPAQSPLVAGPILPLSPVIDGLTDAPPAVKHEMPSSNVIVRSAEQQQQHLLASARMRLAQQRKDHQRLMSSRTAEKERMWEEVRKQSALERDRMRQMSVSSRSKGSTFKPRYLSDSSDGPIRVAVPVNSVDRPITVRVIRPSDELRTRFPSRAPPLSNDGLDESGCKRARLDDNGVDLDRLVPLPVIAGLRPNAKMATAHRFRLTPAPTDVSYVNGGSSSSCAPRMISVIQRAHALILMGASPIVKDVKDSLIPFDVSPHSKTSTAVFKRDDGVRQRHPCDLQRSPKLDSFLQQRQTFSVSTVSSKSPIQPFSRSMAACSRDQTAVYQPSGEGATTAALCGQMDRTTNGRKADAEVLDLTVRP